MKKSKTTFLSVLTILLFASALLAYRDYLTRKDENSINSIIANDARFHDVQVYRKGMGLVLEGHVKSPADLQALFFEINQVKRSRVDSSVGVAQ